MTVLYWVLGIWAVFSVLVSLASAAVIKWADTKPELGNRDEAPATSGITIPARRAGLKPL
jgi:hypothetical protein